MNYYRLTFLKNEIISCAKAAIVLNTVPYYENEQGELVFAIVRARTEAEAMEAGKDLAAEVAEKHRHKAGREHH